MKHFGTSAFNPGARFIRIFTVNDCPAGIENWSRRDRAPHSKRRKASVTKRRNTAPGFNTPDPTFLYSIREPKVQDNG